MLTRRQKNAITHKMFQNKVAHKASELGLTGIQFDVFCFLAVSGGEAGFITLQRRFGSDNTVEIAMALKVLMEQELVFLTYASTRYYTIAIV